MTTLDTAHPAPLLTRMRHWTLLRLVAYLPGIVGPLVLFEWGTHFLVPLPSSPGYMPLRMVLNLAGSVLALLLYRGLVAVFERRGVPELSPRAGHYLAGVLLGAGLIAGMYGVLMLCGAVHVEAGNRSVQVWAGLVGFFCVGITEELLCRVVIFRLLEEAGGTALALVVSGLLFGFAHSFNDNATLASSLDIAIEAGILLGLAYALTHNLWFAAGIHLAWNFTEGNVFGGAVSGFPSPDSLVRSTLAGPDWLTGGSFGLEASAPALAVCLASCVVLGVLVVRTGQWRRWERFRLSLP